MLTKMSDTKIFEILYIFEENEKDKKEIRYIIDEETNKYFFLGKDIALAIGYKDANKAIRSNCPKYETYMYYDKNRRKINVRMLDINAIKEFCTKASYQIKGAGDIYIKILNFLHSEDTLDDFEYDEIDKKIELEKNSLNFSSKDTESQKNVSIPNYLLKIKEEDEGSKILPPSLLTFSGEFGNIRTFNIDNEVYFIAKDIACSLNYSRPRDAVKTHCEDRILAEIIDSNGKITKMFIIPLSDVFKLIFSSKLPNAKKFTNWVTKEVIPSVLKYGIYATDEKLQQLEKNPEEIQTLINDLKKENKVNREKIKRLNEENQDLSITITAKDKCIEELKESFENNINERNKKIDEVREAFEEYIEENKDNIGFSNLISNSSERIISLKGFVDIISNSEEFSDLNDFNLSTFINFLKTIKVFTKDSIPSKKAISKGYFKIKSKNSMYSFSTSKKEIFITGKGQMYLYRKLKKLLELYSEGE